ncbi:MAG: geranylgeranylglycerol-phosphate geranylgeranyltransferase [Chitinophagales bacterium]
MQAIYSWFRLLRGFNLMITALSLYLFQYFVLKPYLAYCGLFPTLNNVQFALFALAVLLIMAGGNVINDFFDFQRDRAAGRNTPIGNIISLDGAYTLHFILTALGVILGFWVSYQEGFFRSGYYFLFAAVFLWIYSYLLKKYFLIGNIVIAALSAFVFVLVVLMEPQLFRGASNDMEQLMFPWIINYMKGYALFAFLTTLIREISKDAEDREGDQAAGMATLPIVLPVWATNLIIVILELICMGLIAWLQYVFWKNGQKKQFWYCMFFLQSQQLLNITVVAGARSAKAYRNQSIFLKVLMLFGILTMPLFYWFTIGKL